MFTDWLTLVCLVTISSCVGGQEESTQCSTSLSNYYVETREQIISQTVLLILSAIPGNDSTANETTNSVLYNRLLQHLSLEDTAEREVVFNQAYNRILASATRTCSRLQGQKVDLSRIDLVQAELTTLLQSEDDMVTAIQDTYGILLCYQGLTRSEELSSFVEDLTLEAQAKIFGLSERPYTLGFVVDDTGSMADEIAKVKGVINFFVNSDTAAPSHYILTSFNDPDVGTPRRYDANNRTEKSQLLSDVNALVAHGGGDCPEFGMTGLRNALSLSEQGGQLILLTDASAKDGGLTDQVIAEANNLGVIVHFMYSHSGGCGLGYPYYDRVKDATGGFRLDDLNRFEDLAMQLQNRRVAFNSISTSVNTSNVSIPAESTEDCKGIPVSSLSESLSIAINPQGGSARVSLTLPNGTKSFDETVSSFTLKDFTSPQSGVWIVCVISGMAEIKQSQEIRFDITAEFLFQNQNTGVYFTDPVPPNTRSQVTILLFTMQQEKLSLSQDHMLKIVNETGNTIAKVTLLLCASFLEGLFSLPSVRYRLFYEGFDVDNNTLIVDLGSFNAGPPPTFCVPVCQNLGTCDENNTCLCIPGFLGKDCSIQAVCEPECVHGICTGVNQCTCDFGYTGPDCNSTQFTPCVINVCLNNGTCSHNLLKDELECSCTPEFTGDVCDKQCSFRFIDGSISPGQITVDYEVASGSTVYCKADDRLYVPCPIGTTFQFQTGGTHCITFNVTCFDGLSPRSDLVFCFNIPEPSRPLTCNGAKIRELKRRSDYTSFRKVFFTWRTGGDPHNVTCQIGGGSEIPCRSPFRVTRRLYESLCSKRHTFTVRAYCNNQVVHRESTTARLFTGVACKPGCRDITFSKTPTISADKTKSGANIRVNFRTSPRVFCFCKELRESRNKNCKNGDTVQVGKKKGVFVVSCEAKGGCNTIIRHYLPY